MKSFQITSILEPRQQPDIPALLLAMENAITDSSNFHARMEHNEAVKGCSWEGQSSDGRKHGEDLQEEASPWEGASDTRMPLAKILVNEANLLATTAFEAGLVQAEAMDSDGDPVTAASVAPLLKWIRSGRRRKPMRDELDYLVNSMNTYGHGIAAVDWHQERALTEQTIEEGDILGMAQQLALQAVGLPGLQEIAAAAQAGEDVEQAAQDANVILQETEDQLRALLLDREKTDTLVALVDALLNPEGQNAMAVSPGEIRRVVTALQKGEPAVYYRPILTANEPRLKALMPWVDVFYPAEAVNLRDQWVARVHWLTESRLKDRAELEGWSESWLETVLKHPGHAFHGTLDTKRRWVLGGSAVYRGIRQARMEDSRQFQVIELYHFATCQGGVPVLYRTVLHPAANKEAAIHEVVTTSADFPFIDFRREREESRYLLDSRGIPEMVYTQQLALKEQHDGRVNRTHLELMPPALVPGNRAGGAWGIGPRAQIPVRRSGTLEFMKIPPVSIDTAVVAREEWGIVNRLFGRMSEDVPAAVTQMHYTKITRDFLTDIGAVFQVMWGLCLEWLPEEGWNAITGQPKPAPDPYGFDLAIIFDVRNLNMEWIRELMEVYSLFVLPADSEGVFNRAEFISYLVNVISPQTAGRFIVKQDAAAQSEVEDELIQLAVIMSGGEPLQKEGQNYAVRLQVLRKFMTSSIEIRNKLAANPQIRAVLEARIKFFENKLQQSQNAMIGRTMRQPVMGNN